MHSFTEYLRESLDVDKLKHLEHLEDHIIHGGNEGVAHAADNLDDVHNLLQGKAHKSRVTTKWDGSPSVIYGMHPETKRFFVASKSAFNKNPKINHTDEDIERNHGHAPGLVQKLKHALHHLPKVMPHDRKGNPHGVYQGDFLYDKSDVHHEDGKYHFTPNTIRYSVKKDSTEGRKVAASKIGFVTHTKYTGHNIEHMKAGFDVDHTQFRHDPDVNHVSPEIKHVDPSRYTPAMRAKFEKHRKAATAAYKQTDPDEMQKLADHNEHIKPYINTGVREGTKPDAAGYKQFLEKRRDKDVASIKTPAMRDKKHATWSKMIDGVHANHKHFQHVFDLHHHLQQAKDTLVHALGNPTDYEHTVGGKHVKPEGFVATRNGRPTKFVDRGEFSRLNFAARPKPVKEEVESEEHHHVFAFGRMNPPTTGHGALIDKVKSVATQHKCDHSVVLSHSNDPEKNPLTAEQKVKHAKRMFPNTNIHAATSAAPTLMHHAKLLHKSGVTHLHVVAGSDRTQEYHDLLHKYNGPTGDYHFKKITVHSAGERDPDAEGVAGMSASKMRHHAIHGDFHSFKQGVPSHVSDEHAKELYHDVRNGMHVPIDHQTPHRDLIKHGKRNDPIGEKAREEMKRRGPQIQTKKNVVAEQRILAVIRKVLGETRCS